MKHVLISFTLISVAILLLAARFTIAVPSQEYSCLFASYFLVDKQDINIKRNRLIAFSLPTNTPYFSKGTRWIKKLVGMPGDHIVVSVDAVSVNGIVYKNNMRQLLMKIDVDEADVVKDFYLNDGQYFVIGETPLSYDSRFWGPIQRDDMIGDAYAML
ncbi:signal peptidase I [Shewanella sp. SG41-4]|uniref:signal peptidase I n=1 Tax=Shewanella sp. SG41-4 TaxID=2760976 RepID=UPI0015FEE860|nr:signal peptidase I [Shewanella sp. SG41-4]MBB1439065.1 signal peptidase I [Shewanella sp. SG41-4]